MKGSTTKPSSRSNKSTESVVFGIYPHTDCPQILLQNWRRPHVLLLFCQLMELAPMASDTRHAQTPDTFKSKHKSHIFTVLANTILTDTLTQTPLCLTTVTDHQYKKQGKCTKHLQLELLRLAIGQWEGHVTKINKTTPCSITTKKQKTKQTKKLQSCKI